MSSLKQKLQLKQPLLGTFLKTPHYQVAEVLSRTKLEVLCIDAEHAPFSRTDLDTCVLSCRANEMPVLIRIPDDAPATILNALDIGATGIVVPHVKTAKQLKAIVEQSFYGSQGRGYAGSTRAAGYTTSTLQDNLENNLNTVVVAQIEDLVALDNIDAIAQVPGCDCLFIGRMDLTVALGETNAKAPSVVAAVEKVVAAANRNNVTAGMFVGDLSELDYWMKKGVCLFLLSSDQSFMLSGASALSQKFEEAKAQLN
ncbi:MAG: 2-keto-3-deoxy-L-rhamnonate aldolase RhmA [Glaciecola sp.]|jgi:2-keto-3-deoxy-L-rhamnonate aldolase RhmA